MSDEDRDVDIESDEDEDLSGGASAATQFMTQAEKRAHHNALERKRRDHIKESFHGLRDSMPTVQGGEAKVAGKNTSASRAQILKQATEYIQFVTKKNGAIRQDIDDLKKQNIVLEQQVRALERAKATGTFAAQSGSSILDKKGTYDEESASDSSETDPPSNRRKKLKSK